MPVVGVLLFTKNKDAGRSVKSKTLCSSFGELLVQPVLHSTWHPTLNTAVFLTMYIRR